MICKHCESTINHAVAVLAEKTAEIVALRNVMQQALDRLLWWEAGFGVSDEDDEVIAALRATLAAPAVADGALVGEGDKPVAYVRLSALVELQDKRVASTSAALHKVQGAGMAPLYAEPQPAQVEPPTNAQSWSPIETAPKDGTNVLLLSDKVNMATGMWLEGICGNGWYLRGENKPNYFFNGHRGPTHWMPLPKPPAIEQASGIGGVKS